jgi:hypothetical protein
MWNYRIIKTTKAGETLYAIHEVFYDPMGAATDHEPVVSEDLDGIRWQLEMMAKAREKPVLEERDGKLVEAA